MVVHCPETSFNGCKLVSCSRALSSFVISQLNTNPYSIDLPIGYNYRDEDRDSFLWYDELYPSEATMRIVAREVTRLLKGQDSPYVTVL